MGLAAGRLRDEVTIQEPNLVDNKRGGRKPAPGEDAWKDVDTVHAEIIALRGGEALQNGIQRGTQLWRVTIRIRDDVTPRHRLVWNGTPLNIRTAAPNEERDGLVMTAESGAVSGG